MPLQIRRAELESDCAALTELLRRNLAPEADSRRFEWLYRESPHGAARAWLAVESESGSVVGAAAAFPRRMYFDGFEKKGWVLGDFCLDAKHRSLGPARQLQRACLRGATNAPFEFCYDFPSLAMMAVYKRLGIQPSGNLVRWARPLRLERKLEPIVRSKLIVRALGTIGNVFFRRRGWKGSKGICELVLHEGRCGPEFTNLDSRVRERAGVFTVRTAEYLNWRYLDKPGVSYEILTAHREGGLIGFTVFSLEGEQGRIVDLCSSDEPEVIACLLDAITELLAARGAATVSLTAAVWHPWSTFFVRAGFRRREESPVVVHAPGGSCPFNATLIANWHLMQGERDS